MNTDDARSELLAQIIDEWEERVRKGERPAMEEYARKYPDLADDLRQVLPGLAAVEEFKGAAIDFTVAPPTDGPTVEGATTVLEQLGDYRILREIGRGGMGVVYEAEQISLGRHVALKVLPQKVLLDSRQRRRFAREAKAAAKLHHTNIVPVFGVGDHEGMPYYVMQFIQGLGLDVVMSEVKRVRDGSGAPVSPAAAAPTLTRVNISAVDVARSLVTGEFRAGGSSEPDTDRDSAAKPAVSSGSGSGTGPLSGSFDSPASSVSLPGQTATGNKSKAQAQTYWQSVAAIGFQVADALEHAHQQGILHRDVKPSNLLLDTRGTVWVTDFGLAKASDHHDDITDTGDVLGTLRYMPPEAFEGRADARSDIYALGLTLFELLALRPAFDEKDRHALIKQVTTSDAPRLDRIRSEVPRDLVTVIHKAIDRDPGRRYQAAGELAEDLQRFIDDEPIKARRMSPVERFTRWSRHNKGLAAALGGVAALLILSTVASVFAMAYFWRQERLQGELASRQGELADQRGKIADTNAQLLAATEREREDARRAADEQARLKNEALAAQKQAEANYQLAVSAVDQFLNKVTTEPVLAGSGLQPLRKKLLQSALPFLEAFVRERGENSAPRGDLAEALSRIGRITNEIGSPQEAAGHLQRAVDIRRQLLKDRPNDRALQADLARDLELIGAMYLRLTELGKAGEAFTAAEETWEADPIDAVFRSGVARVMGLQGDAAWADGNSALAMEKYNKALSNLSLLVREQAKHPEAPVFRLQLAKAMGQFADGNVRLRQLGGAYASVDRSKTPGDFFRDAAILLEALVKDHSRHERAADFRRELALNQERLGEFEAAQDNFGAALAAYKRAADARARLAQDNPLVTDYLADWAQNLAGTARLHAQQNAWPAAAAALTEAVERQRLALKAAPEAAAYVVALAAQLADLGRAEEGRNQPAAALAAYREAGDLLESLASPSREDFYAASVVRARAARFATPDTGEPSAEQKKLRTQLATAAVTDLEKAIAAGFIELEALTTETGFQPVQADERFQRALAGLKTKLVDWKWHEDLDEARALAKKSGKDLLVYFSGSDWCVWCMVVRKGILGREEFLREASKNYVLVLLDSPRYKPQPPNAARSTELRTQWGIRGYPSFVFCDPDLKRIGDFSMSRPTTVPAWVKGLQDIHDRRLSRDKVFAEARDADPARRNELLSEYCESFPKHLQDDYGDELALAVLGRAIDRAPNDPAPYKERADWFLLRKDWRGALPDLRKLFDLTPNDSIHWVKVAAACLKVGDKAAYQEICGALLERSTAATAPEAIERAVKALQLVPPDPATTLEINARLDRVLASDAPSWLISYLQLQKAIAEYQAGNDQAALVMLAKCLEYKNPNSFRENQAQLMKAMVHQRLGQNEAAYDAWAQARTTLDRWGRLEWKSLLPQWHDWLISLSLRTEAETALKANTMFAAGDKARALLDTAAGWVALKPAEFKSAGGATLTLQPDGSILAGGNVATQDTYTVVADLPLARVTALKLEVLPDDSLPKKGPGRYSSGSFYLSELQVAVAPKSGGNSILAVVGDASASFEQSSRQVLNAFDGDPNSSWGILPRTGEANWAVFELKEPASAGKEARLTVTLRFSDPRFTRSSLGRFRLWVSGNDGALTAARARTGLDADPRLAETFTALGVAQALQGESEKAAESLATALDRAADDAVRTRVARQAAGLKGVFDALIKLRPAEPDLFLALARHHSGRGERKQADEARAKARSLYEAKLAKNADDESAAGALADLLRHDRPRTWTVLEPASMRSEGGATLRTLPDGSILASGTNPDNEVYTITAETALRRITAVRLEAIPDPSLPLNTSGRATENGNFALSEFRMQYSPRGSSGWQAIKFVGAHSDHSVPAANHYAKKDMNIDGAIDQKSDTFWESWPKSSQPHWAVFKPAAPIVAEDGMKLLVRLEFHSHVRHSLGRFRLLISDRDDPPFDTSSMVEPKGFAALGDAYAAVGEAAKAAAAFAKAMEKTSDASDRARILELAMAADNVLAELVKLRPNDLRFRLTLARHYAERGRHQDADAEYAQAAALTSGELNRLFEGGWWVSGPHPADTTQTTAYSVGQVPDPSKPVPLAMGPGTIRWRTVTTGPAGRIDLTALGTQAQSAYALACIHSPDERTATLFVTGDGVAVWLNGRSILTVPKVIPKVDAKADPKVPAKKAAAPPQPVARVPITLVSGRNSILLKMNWTGAVPAIAVRLGDESLSRGDELARVGLWADAAGYFKRGKEASTNLHNQRMYALLLLAAGDRDGFRAHCQALIARYGNTEGSEPASTISHSCCLDAEPMMDGARLVELAERAANEIKRPWADFEVALALFRAGRYEPALAKLAATKELQGWPKVWVLQALAHHKLGHADEARESLRKAGEWYDKATREATGPQLVFPFNPGWWELPRFQLLHLEARRLIESPAWKDVNAEILLDRTKKALRPETHDYDLALMFQPNNAQLMLARGTRLLELSRPDEARLDFESAVKLRPKDAQLWRQRGQIEADVGDPGQAAAAFAQFLDLLPQGELWNAPRSRASLELAEQDKVIAKLNELRPKDGLLQVGRARLHAAHGRWAEAAKALKAVIESRPPSEEWYELASFQLLSGDEAGYRMTCQRLIELLKESKDSYAQFSLARACILVPQSPADSAELVITAEAGAAKQTSAWLIHVLAAAHFRAGQYPEALKRLAESEAASWGGRGQSQNALLRALIHAKQGEVDQARASLKKGIELMERDIAASPNRLALANPDWYEFQILRREAEALIGPTTNNDAK